MPEVTIRGRRLGFEARPVDFNKASLAAVFIHGSGGEREEWRGQLDGLSGRFTVIALELPGHGASEPPGESDVSAYAEWVVDFIETLGLEKVVVVGCSLGSAITQWMALSPKPWLVGIGLVGAGARLRVVPSLLNGISRAHPATLASFADYAVAVNADARVRSQVRARFKKGSAKLIHGDLVACDRFDIMNRLAEITLPTCILVGEEDRLTPVKYSRHLHDSIKGSRLAVVPGAGHLVMMEKPEEFNTHLGEFLSTLRG
jgi:pimeloyl-ACP methyl ester carboxylesterase